MKALVLYYSKDGGNTELIAKKVAEGIGADIERVETVLEYDSATIDAQAQKEIDEKTLVPIKQLTKNIKDYDVIVIGTPTWWYSMAPAIRTLLSSTDFFAKIVVLFQTHAGSPGHAIGDMRALCKNAVLSDENIIAFDQNNNLLTPEAELDEWIATIKGMLW